MTPTTYFLACLVMTALWLLLVIGLVTGAVALTWRFRHFAPEWSERTPLQRKLFWSALAWCVASILVAAPSLRTLYAFWGQAS